jgi:threonylcarbamoyladenosine tRNA methylthiotransferase MtaB
MNISFYTLGCKLNYAETSQLREQFEKLGHTVVDFGEPTDAVLINTCTVTENADTECRKIIRRALRTSPNAFVGVTGCYAQLQPEEIASVVGVDAVFGAQEKFKIPQIITDFKKLETPQIFVNEFSDEIEFVGAKSGDNDSRTRAVFKIQDGCNYNCSFCTIPLARGGSRSMDFGKIEEAFKDLEKSGYSEIVLSGINLGDYTGKNGEKFSEVVKLIDSLDTNARVRISSIEPNLLKPEILKTVAKSDVFCPHFHIPLQSGSPEVLKLMRRRYKASYYEELILKIKAEMPHCCIGVDVIVGFPGETDEFFEETYNFLKSLPISYLHVFTYSERENTPAAIFNNKIQPQVKKARTARLRALSAFKKSEFYASQIGSERTVIPETYNAETGRWIGWTENYVRVEFEAPAVLVQKPMRVVLKEMLGEHVLAELTESELLKSENFPLYISILV